MIRLELAVNRAGPLIVSLYDVRGRLVRRVFDGYVDIGSHTVAWDGVNLDGELASPGVYLCRVEAEGTTLSGKLVWNP